jgi:methylisocitrate lyase
MIIMARTDAIAVNGLDDALERARLYHEAGADMLFVEAPATVVDMKRITQSSGVPHVANMVDFGKTPELSAKELEDIGYAAAIWPVSGLLAAARALQDVMTALAKTGTTKSEQARMVKVDEFTELVGLSALRAREAEEIDLGEKIVAAGDLAHASEERARAFLEKIYE